MWGGSEDVGWGYGPFVPHIDLQMSYHMYTTLVLMVMGVVDKVVGVLGGLWWVEGGRGLGLLVWCCGCFSNC